MRPDRLRLRGTRWLTALALAAVPAWSSNHTVPYPIADCVPRVGACGPHPFTVASKLLDAENVRHIVTGRVLSVAGLPATLEEQVDVDVEFEIDGVRKPAARCPHPPRVETKTLCERNDSLPPILRLRIPSDWFLWAPAGTSRWVARRGGEQIGALRKLERDREYGRVGESEYAEAKNWLEGDLQRVLDWTTVFDDGSVAIRQIKPRGVGLLGDRRGHLEVGGEYLFALGDGVEGPKYTYYEPRTYKPNWDWHVFWGDEMREVEVALMLMGNCMQSEPPLFSKEESVRLCGYYSRGLATFRLYPELAARPSRE